MKRVRDPMHLEPLIPPYAPLAVLAIGIDVTTLAVGIAVLRRTEGSARQLAMALLVLAAAALVGGLLARWLFFSGFGVLRVWDHLLWFAGVPLLLTAGVMALRKSVDAGALAAVTLGVLLLGGLVWSHHLEPRWLEVTERTWVTDRLPMGATIRVAILADIQTDRVGDYEASVIERTRAADPDLVLLPGDFVQFRDRERFLPQRDALVELLARLDPPLGIWAVPGDVDFHPDIFDGTNVRMLVDEVVRVPGAPDLQIAGLSLPASRLPPAPDVAAALEAFDGLTIVLAHAPDGALPWIDGRRDDPMLYVAGHTHGGQVVVPGFGPPMTLSDVPRAVAAGGLFEYGAAAVLVSRGVGHERGWAPRLRFACRPELAILELRGAPPER